MMKFMHAIMVLLVLTSFSFSQRVDEDGYTKQDVQKKVQSFSGLRTAGFVMLGTGATSIITGIILASTADWHSYSTPGSAGMTTEDPAGGAGLLLTGLGIPVTVAGIVLSAIGSKKLREYKRRLHFFANYDYRTQTYTSNIVYDF